MRVDWTGFGVCISGSTAHRRGATRRARGGVATTNTTRAERRRECGGATSSSPTSVYWRIGAALCGQRRRNDRLVQVHVEDGRDSDARRLVDVDGVDADVRTGVVCRNSVVPWHV